VIDALHSRIAQYLRATSSLMSVNHSVLVAAIERVS